jgi:hypothetical protein
MFSFMMLSTVKFNVRHYDMIDKRVSKRAPQTAIQQASVLGSLPGGLRYRVPVAQFYVDYR